MKEYTLNNGVKIPIIGFGTYKIPLEKVESSVLEAFDCGYRLIDTASVYKNEEEIGKAIKQLSRDEIFLVDKLWVSDMQRAEEALKQSLKLLGTDYLDMYLIHWPLNSLASPDFEEINFETWNTLIRLLELGYTRTIGVSNFTPKYLEPLMKSKIKPMLNQIEYHPGYLQEKTFTYCTDHDIRLEAWSPLARGRVDNSPLLIDLAKKYDVKISQIILRFIVQTGVIPIPRASSKVHIQENIDIFSFKLSQEEIDAIKALPTAGYSGLHPDTFDRK